MGEQCIDSLIAELSSPDQAARLAARDALVTVAVDHMRSVAHRIARGFPQVRRWGETDDVVQGASLRLARALDAVVPADERHLLNLIATQVRRELIDLARAMPVLSLSLDTMRRTSDMSMGRTYFEVTAKLREKASKSAL